ncbi:AAA family ATPase [Hymenobacter sp. CA2-7]|nr:AAA family ATPase [Hymenobacter sp. CA2-7]MDO7886960.1 AAA family ATPase [Hymenobacter sp. CA2-7]
MLIEEIRVQGYKSLVDATLHVRPLTLLAGTNSSGKSSIMQPLLLIKQTMEAPYQPAGALVLDGAHVQAETAGELVSKLSKEKFFTLKFVGKNVFKKKEFPTNSMELTYGNHDGVFKILSQTNSFKKNEFVINPNSAPDEIRAQFTADFEKEVQIDKKLTGTVQFEGGMLNLRFANSKGEQQKTLLFSVTVATILGALMHIPGLRSIPKRAYPATFFRDQIKGTFDLYSAGTISQWQQESNTEALAQLNDSLQRLGLTNTVTAKVKNANEVELSVNRLPSASKAKPRKADMVNIADVGIGVSQVLPILVALIAAQEGQIVYVEQPELHLHPRAQVAMGELLAEAANRGVRVIVETHSSLLLLTVQTLIAQGKIANTDVGLHWFTRDAKGASQVQYVVPDEDGAYGEWPEDFSEIELKAQDAYLTAVGLRQFGEAAK